MHTWACMFCRFMLLLACRNSPSYRMSTHRCICVNTQMHRMWHIQWHITVACCMCVVCICANIITIDGIWIHHNVSCSQARWCSLACRSNVPINANALRSQPSNANMIAGDMSFEHNLQVYIVHAFASSTHFVYAFFMHHCVPCNLWWVACPNMPDCTCSQARCEFELWLSCVC